MWIVFFLIALLLLSFMYNNGLKIKEKCTLLIGLCTMIAWGLIFAMVDMLKIGIFLMYVFLLIGGGIYAVKNRTQVMQYLQKLPIVAFIVAVIITSILYMVRPPFFTSWDEFSHWGPFLFNIKDTNALHLFSDKNFVHQAYPQAMTVLYYLGSYFKTGYSEADVCLIYSIFLHTCTIMIVPNVLVRERRRFSVLISILIPFFLYAMPYVGYAAPYTSVYLDAILGGFFGAIMYFIIQIDKKTSTNMNTLCVTILLFVLLQVKDVSIAFYMICLATYVISLLNQILQQKVYEDIKRKTIIGIKSLFVVFFFPMLGKYMWSYCLKITNKSEDQFSESLAKKFFIIFKEYQTGENEYFEEVLKAFWGGIKNVNISWERTSILVVAFAYLLVGIWIAHKYYVLKKEKIIYIDMMLFVVYFICYMFMLFVIYLCAMTTDEAMSNASMDRYTACFFMGWGFLLGALIIDYLYVYRPRLIIGIISSLIIFVYATIPLNTVPYFTSDKESTGILWCEEKAEIIKSYIDPNEKIWFAEYNAENWMYKAIYLYKLMPCSVDWNVPLDISSFSIDDIIAISKDAGIEYLVVMDSNIPFIERYCEDIVEKGNGGDDRVMIFNIDEQNIVRLY